MTTLIGVDCATEPRNSGIAVGKVKGQRLVVSWAGCASKSEPPCQIIKRYADGSDRLLLALDAPLGWPTPLGPSLIGHSAGQVLSEPADRLFRRLTDNAIYDRLKKRSFDVGANLIARTAHSALRLLDELRKLLKDPIPLAWTPAFTARAAAIEVYPAATLRALGLHHRSGLFANLPEGIVLPTPLPSSDHARDAIICAVAAFDFLRGCAVAPTRTELKTAKREGWIWTTNAPP